MAHVSVVEARGSCGRVDPAHTRASLQRPLNRTSASWLPAGGCNGQACCAALAWQRIPTPSLSLQPQASYAHTYLSPTTPLSRPQARHLSEDEYAKNHPAGRIGKRLMLRVADVMLHREEELPLVRPDMLMADVLMELTSKG